MMAWLKRHLGHFFSALALLFSGVAVIAQPHIFGAVGGNPTFTGVQCLNGGTQCRYEQVKPPILIDAGAWATLDTMPIVTGAGGDITYWGVAKYNCYSNASGSACDGGQCTRVARKQGPPRH